MAGNNPRQGPLHISRKSAILSHTFNNKEAPIMRTFFMRKTGSRFALPLL